MAERIVGLKGKAGFWGYRAQARYGYFPLNIVMPGEKMSGLGRQLQVATVTLPRLINEKIAAEILAVSVELLQQDRVGARKIPFIKIGRSVRYDPNDLARYIDACKVRG